MSRLNDAVQKGLDSFAKDGLALIRRMNAVTENLTNREGRKGPHGRDCVGADTLRLTPSKGGTEVKFIFESKGLAKSASFDLGFPIYRGAYESEKPYNKGDTVTFDGATWIANRLTQKRPHSEPGNHSPDWSLVVKAGRDGSKGRDGERGERGDVGPSGFDKTTTNYRKALDMDKFDKANEARAKAKAKSSKKLKIEGI